MMLLLSLLHFVFFLFLFLFVFLFSFLMLMIYRQVFYMTGGGFLRPPGSFSVHLPNFQFWDGVLRCFFCFNNNNNYNTYNTSTTNTSNKQNRKTTNPQHQHKNTTRILSIDIYICLYLYYCV